MVIVVQEKTTYKMNINNIDYNSKDAFAEYIYVP